MLYPHGSKEKIQGTYFEICLTYFKISQTYFLPSENPFENRDKNKDKNGRRIMHCLMQTVTYPYERHFYTLYTLCRARRIIVQINGGKLYQKDESCRY